MIISNRYKVLKQLGSGAFGKVFLVEDIEGNNVKRALKIETLEKTNQARLPMEYKLYKYLEEIPNVPNVYDLEKITSSKNNSKQVYIVMDYLGETLENLLDKCGGTFSLKTTLMIGIQLISNLEKIHNKGIIHRDIKPDNCLVGTEDNKDLIYLVDFGLSKRILKNEKHITYSNNHSFVGSLRYASIRTHKGIECSRRDDLESLFYMLLYFYLGRLPWQGVKEKDKKEMTRKICEIKRNIPIPELIKDAPIEFGNAIQYIRLLRFEETPDYRLLKKYLVKIFMKQNYDYDFKFDWLNQNNNSDTCSINKTILDNYKGHKLHGMKPTK